MKYFAVASMILLLTGCESEKGLDRRLQIDDMNATAQEVSKAVDEVTPEIGFMFRQAIADQISLAEGEYQLTRSKKKLEELNGKTFREITERNLDFFISAAQKDIDDGASKLEVMKSQRDGLTQIEFSPITLVNKCNNVDSYEGCKVAFDVVNNAKVELTNFDLEGLTPLIDNNGFCFFSLSHADSSRVGTSQSFEKLQPGEKKNIIAKCASLGSRAVYSGGVLTIDGVQYVEGVSVVTDLVSKMESMKGHLSFKQKEIADLNMKKQMIAK